MCVIMSPTEGDGSYVFAGVDRYLGIHICLLVYIYVYRYTYMIVNNFLAPV